MIEFGEPLHIYFSVCFVIFIAYLFYLMCKDIDREIKNEQKKTN